MHSSVSTHASAGISAEKLMRAMDLLYTSSTAKDTSTGTPQVSVDGMPGTKHFTAVCGVTISKSLNCSSWKERPAERWLASAPKLEPWMTMCPPDTGS